MPALSSDASLTETCATVWAVFLDSIRLYFGDPNARDRLCDACADDRLDWDGVVALASYHSVVPLVRASVAETAAAFPERARRRLDEAFAAYAALSLLYARELARLPLEAAGIPALALKGPALAVQLYGKTSLRQCSDLDILVAKTDVTQAIHILNSTGYRLDDSYSGRPDALETDKHLLFIHRGTEAKVELHWAIALPARRISVDFELLWSNRGEVSLFGTSVAVPGLTDLPLVLAVHGTSHHWTSLKWVCDFAAFLRQNPDLDWEGVRVRASRAGCWRMILVALALANSFTGIPMPRLLKKEVARDRTVNVLLNEARRRILSTHTLSLQESRDWFEILFTEIRLRERFGDRVRLASVCVGSTLAREAGCRRMDWRSATSTPIYAARLIRRSWRNTLRLLTTVTASQDVGEPS
jgi:hypothetical protein